MYGAAIVITHPTHTNKLFTPNLFKMSVCELSVHLSIWYYVRGWQPCAQMCPNVHSSQRTAALKCLFVTHQLIIALHGSCGVFFH